MEITIDELIQLMRTCSLAKVRAQLEEEKKNHPNMYKMICYFYEAAAQQKV